MKKQLLLIPIVLFCLLTGFQIALAKDKRPVIISYVTSWTKPLPDPSLISHINYAFGHVNATFDGVRIDNPNRLHEIVAIKKSFPHVKVLLSIGGWGSGRFSEMAADAKLRQSFAADCAKAVKDFKLDGIDIDWEYPTSKAGGISASPEDTDNFTLLMRDIRKAIGKSKLLTLATVADGKYIDFKAIKKDINFVNIMMYDVSSAPKAHASLYRSDISGRITLTEALDAHMEAGLPKHMIVMGIPFYGRGNKKDIGDFVLYRDVDEKGAAFEKKYDDVAKVPYLINKDGEVIFTYENVPSIQEKAAYIKKSGILGAMYWEFAGDNDALDLSKALYNGLK